MRCVQHQVVNRGPDLCPAMAEHPGSEPMAHRAAVFLGVGKGRVRPGHSNQAVRPGIRTRVCVIGSLGGGGWVKA